MTNEELVRQYYDGDETALEKLYHKNIGLIRGIAKEAAADFNCLTVDKHHPNRFSAYTKTVLDDLCGEGTLELRARMRAHGVRRTTDERTPEDHIGLMLALMSYLARNQPDDLDEFLQIHLLTWSSHFLDQLVEAADHPFYEGLARLAKASLEGIQQARDIDVTYPRFYR